jgi:succinate-semialdehyde dehydrogenase / glutarate-semialdehyde dehydrogenase
MSYQSVNPANGKILQTFKETTDQELEAALKTAASLLTTSATPSPRSC